MENIADFIDALEYGGIDVARDVAGSALTTYRVGGPIAYLITLGAFSDIEILARTISTQFYGQLSENDVVTIGN